MAETGRRTSGHIPRLIVLIAGKRKSGKDHVSELLQAIIGSDCVVMHISSPIKRHFASLYGVDFHDLSSDKPLKETYRAEMIRWSEAVRRERPGYFIEEAIKSCEGNRKDIWIFSDIRRKSDVEYFRSAYNSCDIKLIKVFASEESRKSRGWTFCCGVDDAESECDLDDLKDWDYVIDNSEGIGDGYLTQQLESVKAFANF